MKTNKKISVDHSSDIQAQTQPMSVKEKLLYGIIIALIVLFICSALFFVGRYALFCINMNNTRNLVDRTLTHGSTAFTAKINYGSHEISTKGSYEYVKSEKTARAFCELDYGDRVSELSLNASGNDLYISTESDVSENYLHVDISSIRYAMNKGASDTGASDLLKTLSTDDIKLEDYYDADKLNAAVKTLHKKLTQPSVLYSFMSCTSKNGEITLNINSYKFILTVAKTVKGAFKTEESHKNLLKAIEAERDALEKESVTVTFTQKDNVIDSFTVSINGESQIKASVALSELGTASVGEQDEISKDLYETVSPDSAIIRVLRSGLNIDAAYKEASMSLNAFQEHFAYNIKAGTIVVLRDERDNVFQFVYSDQYTLKSIEYGDELYNVWASGGYIQLDTTNLDSGAYKIAMYEPATVKSDTQTSDGDYNNAYLSALQAFRAITDSGYKMTENAIFVVTENDNEFQFIYQDGDLYNVYEQYYYIVYSSYGAANISDVQGLPENVKLYIPNTNDK